jgi:hypothetical protein
MSDAEEGIARIQAAATRAQGTQGRKLQEHQQRSVAYMDDRILTFVLAIAFIGLVIIWATATSAVVLYGSLAAVVILTVFWGLARVKSIERTRRQREREAKEWQADNSE